MKFAAPRPRRCATWVAGEVAKWRKVIDAAKVERQ